MYKRQVLYLLLSEFVNKRLQKKGTVVAAEGPAAAGPEGEQPPPYRESLPEKQIGQAASAEKSEGEAAAVSYTHLDVYKRQVQRSKPRRRWRRLITNFYLSGNGSLQSIC